MKAFFFVSFFFCSFIYFKATSITEKVVLRTTATSKQEPHWIGQFIKNGFNGGGEWEIGAGRGSGS